MSSFKVRRLPVARLSGTTTETHPRGKGFGVLSRIARVQADDGTDYAPRHRRDVPVDAEALVPAAD
jgi:hypothetical protein